MAKTSGPLRACLHGALLGALLAAAAALAVAAGGASAQSVSEEPFTPLNRRVESTDLPPALLPPDLWRGLDAAAFETPNSE